MMRHTVKIIICFALLGFSIMMPAQTLPVFPKDGRSPPAILQRNHLLPFDEPFDEGCGRFRPRRKRVSDNSLSARKSFRHLPHFNKTIPYKFLSRKGIGCRSEGYISFSDEATIFRFDDVPIFNQAASDTTLLMLLDLISGQPCPHAVIIAGDINPAAIIERMNVFSLMVPSRTPFYKKKEYVWRPSEEAEYSFIPSRRFSVTVAFRSPRTPDDQMNTIQPFISELFSRSFGGLSKPAPRKFLGSGIFLPGS